MRTSRADSCRCRAGAQRSRACHKTMGGEVIAGTVFRNVVQAEIVGSIDARRQRRRERAAGAGAAWCPKKRLITQLEPTGNLA